MLRVKDFAKFYRVVLHTAKPLARRSASNCPYGQDPRAVQDPLRRENREACPRPPPPPPPPPKDDRWLWGTVAATIVTAAFCVAAKNNPELRDWVSIYAPWFDDVIAIAFEENISYGHFLANTIQSTRRLFMDYLEDAKRGKPKECSLEEPPNAKVVDPIYEKMTPCDEKADEKEIVACELVPPPLITLDICEVERCLKDLGETMLLNYMTARDACRVYNKTVEEALNNYTQQKMNSLQAAEDERRQLVKESLCNAEEAKCKLEQLSKYLTCGVVSSKENIQSVCDMVKNMRSNIERMRIKYQWEDDKSTVLDDEWKMVKEAVEKFMQQSEALIPGLKYDNPRSKMKGDVDLLLYHTSRYVRKLEGELDEAVEAMTERVNLAIDALTYCPKRCSAIIAATAKKQAQLGCHYNKMFQLQKAENEENARRCMEQQACQFAFQLDKRLRDKQIFLEKQLAEMVAERVAKERKQMNLDLRLLGDKLRQVEEKLNARLRAEAESRRSQELWTASVGLLAATKKGTPRVSVKRELKAIEKAAGNSDPLVRALLSGIPNSVRENGLVPESVLRKRYANMEKVALKVAMVELEGGPLPMYAMSWIQWLFLFMKMHSIPYQELGEKPADPVSEDLDTFDLLQRARYYIERNELAKALRYVSALQGASQGAAQAWLQDARAHLATRQAADALLAHAQSLGVKYI